MTAPALSLVDLPGVSDAIRYATGKLADWQLVPQRLSAARSAVGTLSSQAAERGDPGTVAQLTIVKQSLDGIGQEYVNAQPLVAEVLQAVNRAQAGQSISPAVVADAARLVAVMTANLAALATDERQLQQMGGNLTVGAGGVNVPPWLKWGLIGAGVWWLLRRIL